MIPDKEFILSSLEMHLFFDRIMKEHAVFFEAAFVTKNEELAKKADYYKREFSYIQREALAISEGVISFEFLESGQVVTKYTLSTEEKTSMLSGIPIDTCITKKERGLLHSKYTKDLKQNLPHVLKLNSRVNFLLSDYENFHKSILRKVTSGELFIWIYPDMIEHMLGELYLYKKLLLAILERRTFNKIIVYELENVWNLIMCEHAEFIRGLLDPSEKDLIITADRFSKEYGEILEAYNKLGHYELKNLTKKSKKETFEFNGFLKEAVEGILDVKIKGLIIPLLADHLLRESNHYIYMLNEIFEIINS